mmetsp:Transcript_57768/g.124244  ORF Transcript_57768/g.124244 Transcript_57768/m.124244 type:complete len:522 (+) Transcript_57768:778-2343(+)
MSRLFSPVIPCSPDILSSMVFILMVCSLSTLALARSISSHLSVISRCRVAMSLRWPALLALRLDSSSALVSASHLSVCSRWAKVSSCRWLSPLWSERSSATVLARESWASVLSRICSSSWVLVSLWRSVCLWSMSFIISSTCRLRASTSSLSEETISLTTEIFPSRSSLLAFQSLMLTFSSNLAWVLSLSCKISLPSWSHLWWHSCRLEATSSIQASWAFSASCMSPISSRIVEISAVTVASTRCLLVMIEWVESTRALISSRSTLTASIAAVKSSISRSQARTMRFTWAVSLLAPVSMSFISPRSYLRALMSLARSSGAAPGAPGVRVRVAMAEAFLSRSLLSFCICSVICASKSESLEATFFINCPSPALPLGRNLPTLPGSSSPSASTRVSSFLNRSASWAPWDSVTALTESWSCCDFASIRDEAYLLTSSISPDVSPVDPSRIVWNADAVSSKLALIDRACCSTEASLAPSRWTSSTVADNAAFCARMASTITETFVNMVGKWQRPRAKGSRGIGRT